MAYVSREKKGKVMSLLKGIVPKDWKWSLKVDNGSSLVMTISEGPKELAVQPAHYEFGQWVEEKVDLYRQINTYYPDKAFPEGPVNDKVVEIVKALNLDNYNNSDLHTDYHDVGHYVNLHVGRWNKPYVVKEAVQ